MWLGPCPLGRFDCVLTQESCLTRMLLYCSLFTLCLIAIAYQQQNRSHVCHDKFVILLSWTVVPKLQPEDWII